MTDPPQNLFRRWYYNPIARNVIERVTVAIENLELNSVVPENVAAALPTRLRSWSIDPVLVFCFDGDMKKRGGPNAHASIYRTLIDRYWEECSQIIYEHELVKERIISPFVEPVAALTLKLDYAATLVEQILKLDPKWKDYLTEGAKDNENINTLRLTGEVSIASKRDPHDTERRFHQIETHFVLTDTIYSPVQSDRRRILRMRRLVDTRIPNFTLI